MASVEIRPGDTLNVVCTSTQNTPLGRHKVESSFAFTYDELLTKLQRGPARRGGTEGARFSRVVALSTNAMKKGKWSTGADIDRTEVFERMMKEFEALERVEYANITPFARRALNALVASEGLLDDAGKKRLATMLKNSGMLEAA